MLLNYSLKRKAKNEEEKIKIALKYIK